MTLFAEKLKDAGYDTVGARLAAETVEALRRHPHSVVDAWRYVGEKFGYEYVRERMKDMKGPAENEKSPPTPLSKGIAIGTSTVIPKPYQPRPKLDPAKLETAKAKVIELMFGQKTADGRDWAEVGAHELNRFEQDGSIAHEIKKELPVLSGNMRFANLRDLITAKQFAAAHARAKEWSK